MNHERELWVTPEAEEFLRTVHEGQDPEAFASELVRQLTGKQGKRGMITLVRPRYLAMVIGASTTGNPDRVLVWHGPTDGIFFNEAIMDRASRLGFSVA